jgi:hypothetical protein
VENSSKSLTLDVSPLGDCLPDLVKSKH